MTAEEAIGILKVAVAEVEWNYPMDYAVAIETAIQALENNISAAKGIMSELIEMPYGNGKALEREFIKAYTEVQLDVEMKRKQCEDCLLVNSKDCPEYKESKEDVE